MSADAVDSLVENTVPDACNDDLESNIGLDTSLNPSNHKTDPTILSEVRNLSQPELQVTLPQDERQPEEIYELSKSQRIDENELSSEYFSAADTHQSILVSFSSHCVLKGTVCERSRLMRIKFYGCFDKPLGRYLRDDLFDQVTCYRFPFPYFSHFGDNLKIPIDYFLLSDITLSVLQRTS